RAALPWDRLLPAGSGQRVSQRAAACPSRERWAGHGGGAIGAGTRERTTVRGARNARWPRERAASRTPGAARNVFSQRARAAGIGRSDMTAVLSTLLDLSVIVFAVASMLSVGLGQTVRQILDPLRNVGAVIRAVIANFVLVPLLALLVLRLIPIEPPLAVGLFLIAAAAGAPFLIKLVEAAGGHVPLSGSLLVLLVPLTIVYMPIV